MDTSVIVGGNLGSYRYAILFPNAGLRNAPRSTRPVGGSSLDRRVPFRALSRPAIAREVGSVHTWSLDIVSRSSQTWLWVLSLSHRSLLFSLGLCPFDHHHCVLHANCREEATRRQTMVLVREHQLEQEHRQDRLRVASNVVRAREEGDCRVFFFIIVRSMLRVPFGNNSRSKLSLCTLLSLASRGSRMKIKLLLRGTLNNQDVQCFCVVGRAYLCNFSLVSGAVDTL